MKFCISFVLLIWSVLVCAQGPHSQLIDITKQKANIMSAELGLNPSQSMQLKGIYVKHALATEDVIVSSDPEINLLKEIKLLSKQKGKDIKALFSSAEYQLYKHKIEQAEERAGSEFDSLQLHLNNPEFNDAVITYFDEDVSPYLVYYHQTYFRPALKQKHYFKINQLRLRLATIQYRADSLSEVGGKKVELTEEMSNELDASLKELKKLRKKYKEELDYVNVAMSTISRQWDKNYIKIVQEHYDDDVYQNIKDYGSYLNAYGINYLVGGFSLLLFDIYYPRSYIENRDLLIEMIGNN